MKGVYNEFYNMYMNITLIDKKNEEYDERLRELEEGLVEIRVDIIKLEKHNGGFKIKIF